MNRQTQIGLVGGVVVVMFLLVWLFSGGSGDNPNQKGKQRQPFVSSNWNVRYQINDKKPLGLYLFTALTNAHIDTNRHINVVKNEWDIDSIVELKGEKTYMFVGNNFGLNDREMDSILTDVARGSDLFISFDNLTENLYPMLFKKESFRLDYDQEISVYMNNERHNMINIYQNDTIACDWWAFGEVEFYGPHIGLSSFMEMDNFVKVQLGDGFIYLHATPNLFYNYQVKRTDGFKYASKVLDELPKDQDVYLLEIARLSDNYGDYDTSEQDGDGGKQDNSYLTLIFKDPMLRTAMLLSILGMILFVIFRSKRKRPVVPYLKKRKDMTLAFAETITSIYFSKRNAYGLLQVQKKNFYDTMHRYFFVDLYKRNDDREIRILAEKTNSRVEEIQAFVNAFETTEAFGVNDQMVTDIAKKRYNFYRKVGIISDKLDEKIQSKEIVFKRSLLPPALMLLVGIGLIIFALYMLTNAVGAGIILVPIGIVLIFMASARLSRPCLIVNKDKMIFYGNFGRKRTFNREDLLSTELRKSGVIFHFNNKKLIINFWDLSRFDRQQFERLVSKMHSLEL